MKYTVKSFAAVTVAVALALSQVACDSSDYKKSAQASADMARGVSTALDLEAALLQQGLLEKEAAISVTRMLLNLNRAVRQFNDTAKKYKNFDATAKAELLKVLQDVTAALSVLNSQGVLYIKNPTSKQQLDAALSVVSAAIAVLQSVLGAKPAPGTGTKQPVGGA